MIRRLTFLGSKIESVDVPHKVLESFDINLNNIYLECDNMVVPQTIYTTVRGFCALHKIILLLDRQSRFINTCWCSACYKVAGADQWGSKRQ